ncbi:translation initiation factor IF-2-like [Vulpes lagopus]|uniref:translation initiation factor IF-2-like n=1 Tax=Vulpes lagopus TaxID=494514 RepID=UPI001BC9A93F|nr:translation initiation factor IF-2-like [Vulpes lagopus]
MRERPECPRLGGRMNKTWNVVQQNMTQPQKGGGSDPRCHGPRQIPPRPPPRGRAQITSRGGGRLPSRGLSSQGRRRHRGLAGPRPVLLHSWAVTPPHRGLLPLAGGVQSCPAHPAGSRQHGQAAGTEKAGPLGLGSEGRQWDPGAPRPGSGLRAWDWGARTHRGGTWPLSRRLGGRARPLVVSIRANIPAAVGPTLRGLAVSVLPPCPACPALVPKAPGAGPQTCCSGREEPVPRAQHLGSWGSGSCALPGLCPPRVSSTPHIWGPPSPAPPCQSPPYLDQGTHAEAPPEGGGRCRVQPLRDAGGQRAPLPGCALRQEAGHRGAEVGAEPWGLERCRPRPLLFPRPRLGKAPGLPASAGLHGLTSASTHPAWALRPAPSAVQLGTWRPELGRSGCPSARLAGPGAQAAEGPPPEDGLGEGRRPSPVLLQRLPPPRAPETSSPGRARSNQKAQGVGRLRHSWSPPSPGTRLRRGPCWLHLRSSGRGQGGRRSP